MPTDLGGIDPGAVTADDPSPVTDRDRLRDAFAQLIARQRGQAVPMNALMQAQAMQQGLMKPPGPLPPDLNNGAAPMPQAVPQQPNLNFPTAPAGPGVGTMNGPRPKPEKPFHGKGEYALPSSEKPKKGKKANG